MNNIRYMYLRDETKFPIALVSFVIDRNENKVVYGIATFNPNEMHGKRRVTFDRKFLREVSVGRLVLEKKTVSIPKQEYNSLAKINHAIVADLNKNEGLPKRTKKAIERWLRVEAATKSYISIGDSDKPLLN